MRFPGHLTRLLVLLSGLALTPAGLAQTVEMIEPSVIARYPHDTDAFTQGLFVSEGRLYESTGQVGQSGIREVDLDSGRILRRADLPIPFFGEGSVRLGSQIYMLSWRGETGFIFDAETFEETGRFRYDGEGWGLTTDGTHLIMSNGSPELQFMDPETFEIVRTVEVTLNNRPIRRLNELEWVNGEIWANVWMLPSIVRIEPQSGVVTGLINLSDLVPEGYQGSRDAVANGIAWDADNERLFLTGKLWPVLLEIDWPPAPNE